MPQHHGQRDGVGHGHEIRVDGDGQHVEQEQPAVGKAALPPAAEIVVQRPQQQELGGQRGVAQRPFPQNRAENKDQIADQRQDLPLGKQTQQQGAEPALQEQTEQGEPAEILEGPGQQGGEQPEKGREQRDGVGVGHAEPCGPVDRLGNAQREPKRALAVEQPAGIVLLDVLFNIAAAAEGIVGDIQRRRAEDQQKGSDSEKTAADKQKGVAPGFASARHTGSSFAQNSAVLL